MSNIAHKTFQRRSGKPIEDAGASADMEAVRRRLAALAQTKPASLTDGVERRTGPERKKVYKAAKIYLTTVDFIACTVLDLSADGARISITEEQSLPQFIELRFDDSGVQKKARIAWQHQNEFGLSFMRVERVDPEDNAAVHYDSGELTG